ncbi:MAG: IclR family transcriptional regulator [Halobacteriales archaeon]
MSPADEGGAVVKSARTLFDVVEGLEALEEAGVSELADHLDLAVSTVHDHVTTLVELGYVQKADERYRLGLSFLGLGESARYNLDAYPLVEPYLEKVADETGESAWFVVEEDGLAVYVAKARGEVGVETANRIGRRSRMHYHAGGKAILAHLPRARVEAIVDRHGLPGLTENTITDLGALFDELEAIREAGFAQNDNEEIVGTRSVAAPILVDDRVLGAISVGGPANRLKGERFDREFPDLVSGVTNEIELKIQYSDPAWSDVD